MVLEADVGQPISQIAPLDIGTPEVVVATDTTGFVVSTAFLREVDELRQPQAVGSLGCDRR